MDISDLLVWKEKCKNRIPERESAGSDVENDNEVRKDEDDSGLEE